MKLIVFAHTPPPHHGQSFMVKCFLEQMGGDCRMAEQSGAGTARTIYCYHVNARLSATQQDIGEIQFMKIAKVLLYCAEAIWCRFRYGADSFYYVPAPGKRAALYRDWVIALLCRPFFRNWIQHWEASGLAEWLENHARPWERAASRALLRKPQLAIALSISAARDAEWFESRRIAVVANGIADPFPDFETAILPRRVQRLESRRRLLGGKSEIGKPERPAEDSIYRVAYLALCTRSKGLFVALEGVALANERLHASGSPLRIHLTVAGSFPSVVEQEEFAARIRERDLSSEAVEYVGFISGDDKRRLLLTSDCLCFPSYYEAECQPLSILEAMAAGLAIVATHWRALPETLPPAYPFLIAPRSADDLATAFLRLLPADVTADLRQHFLKNFTESKFGEAMREALLAVGSAQTNIQVFCRPRE